MILGLFMNWQSATCEMVVLIQKLGKASEMSIIQKKRHFKSYFYKWAFFSNSGNFKSMK